jgi:hypothetical protein
MTITQDALRQLRRNAAIETLAGAAIICIVAVLGTEPPASHAHQHTSYETVPSDAAFIHIHSEQGMADVTIMPGRPGMARATIRLWNKNFEPLAAQEVTFALTAPAGSKPITRFASQNSDGVWKVDEVGLSQPGNWTVTVRRARSYHPAPARSPDRDRAIQTVMLPFRSDAVDIINLDDRICCE